MVSICIFLITGCGTTGVVKISPDTYIISKSSKAGAFASMAKLRATVIREANSFAEKQGKVAIPISLESDRPDVGFPTVDYQFRVVGKDDPEAQRTSLKPRADMVIEKSEDVKVDVKLDNTSAIGNDLYTELSKLDDLRKRGIITDEEFNTQKQKLLNR